MVAALEIRHSGGTCTVRIGPGAADAVSTDIDALLPGHRPVVIADSNTVALRPDLWPGITRLDFPAGEASKSRDTWVSLSDRLLDLGVDRRTVIIALGGGVTTDLAGMVASTLLRGVPWVAVPTTTLAMVDAALGGKTGVDTQHGKNLIGSFHHPALVVVDPLFLATLPDEIHRDGLAEVVKHAAIADAGQWRRLEQSADELLALDQRVLPEVLAASIGVKVGVVNEDEREQGRRATLNTGHTIAHALELASNFGLSHGKAVAIGLVLETRLGETLGVTEPGTAGRIATLLDALGLPGTAPGSLDRQRFRDALLHDKKNRDGTIRVAFLSRIGDTARDHDGSWTIAVPAEALEAALEQR
ncbi:MAG TPA: 3-dehydroquinate synthase [Gemmatimonadales bacterium]|nr:3-dehydroquinate synthase [Gemmatimonadales bacterium]